MHERDTGAGKGEDERIEFKESLANLDKELVAFANSSGGRIFVGITNGRKRSLFEW